VVHIEEAGAERLDDVCSLWLALHEHHRGVAAHLGSLAPLRTPDDAWPDRCADMTTWLAEPESVLLLARDADDALVGFALVRVRGPETLLDAGERVGEIESIAVDPAQRGGGVGTVLLEASHQWLAKRGVTHVGLVVVAANEGARRLYERWGMRATHMRYLGPVAPPGRPSRPGEPAGETPWW
jgi:ribosomal protein S18 acetylase RimI-like enzyme